MRPAVHNSSATRLATRPPIDLPPMMSGAPAGTSAAAARYSSISPSALGTRPRVPVSLRRAM